MIGDWALADEGMALKAAETIPSEMAEALSFGLLQASIQFRKWSRKEAEGAFEKTLKAAERISDRSLRGQRMLQIAREWQLVNREKGKRFFGRLPMFRGFLTGGQNRLWIGLNCFIKNRLKKI